MTPSETCPNPRFPTSSNRRRLFARGQQRTSRDASAGPLLYVRASCKTADAMVPEMKSYRADIDGLRGVAVLAVLLFHGFPGLLRGGFIGVDIFFVISGYLITDILLGNQDRGRFRLFDFYRHRVRRIFPTLVVVLAACFAFGWLVLFADEFARLGEHIAASAVFISNFVLWKEAGYFDVDSQTKPLLHLWSLAVEEQFYLLWPPLLWLAWRLRLPPLGLAGLCVALSFAVCVIFAGRDPTAGFFFSPRALLGNPRRRHAHKRGAIRHTKFALRDALCPIVCRRGARRRRPFADVRLSDLSRLAGLDSSARQSAAACCRAVRLL